MRIPLPCMTCAMETLGVTESPRFEFPDLGDINDDNAYVGRCSRGHTVAVALQNPKHEVLYESAAVALLCGFHREAVASFAAALERFYEYAARVLLDHLGASQAEIDDWWPLIKKQSERQVGAFSSLYLAATKRAWRPPHNLAKLAETRNEVVHNGAIVDRAVAMDFGRKVFEVVESTIDVLRATAADAMGRQQLQAVAKASAAVAKKVVALGLAPARGHTSGGATFILASHVGERSPDLDPRLRDLEARLGRFVPMLARGEE